MTDSEIRAIAAQLAFDAGITREEAERIVRAKISAGQTIMYVLPPIPVPGPEPESPTGTPAT